MNYLLLVLFSFFLLTACTSKPGPSNTHSQYAVDENTLQQILEVQPDEVKARYQYRNPKETLAFFGIAPGMTVVEVLPGGGWYSKLLLPYLGKNGELIGVDYAMAMWPNFDWAKPEFIEKRKSWTETWKKDAQTWAGENGAQVSAYTFASLPESLSESADAVLFIRALHNLSRFNDKGDFMKNALNESYRVLKRGGVLGVVQHRSPEDMADSWADGSRGYLKKSLLVRQIEKHGFEFVDSSDINANLKDHPGPNDIVWRLPPSYYTSKKNETLKAMYKTIGESNRMTLLFKKP